MSNEFKVPYATGQNLYGLLLNDSAQIWNGSAFETANSAHLSTYVLSLSELASLGLYLASFPTALTTAGTYFFAVRLRQGSTAATSDPFIGGAPIRWNGSAELFPAAPGDQMDLVNSPNSTAKSALAQASAAAILQTPANLLTTDSSGEVTAGTMSSSAKTAVAQATAAAILQTPANLLATDSSGEVTVGTLSSGAIAAVNAAGSGPIAINQNTGGTDNLRYVDSNGNGVAGATVLIYSATDWPGNPSRIQAEATTGSDGRWLEPAYVAHGTYIAVFTKPGADGPNASAAFTV